MKYKSKSIKEIVHCFGYEDLTENDWHSLTDGRLLSWMYSHEDKMACEALRIMTAGQTYSKALAYKVLYNIDRDSAYDLREAKTPETVGRLLASYMMEWQSLSDDDFAERIGDFLGSDGRFAFYAQVHGWNSLLAECRRCFDLKSEENRERLGDYDLRTAAYRFCQILEAPPSYVLPSGKVLTDGRALDKADAAEMRSEMRNGCMRQWMAVFFHENPKADFSSDLSYERSLEEWTMAIGAVDQQQKFYRRYIKAKEETKRKYDEVRSEYNRSCQRAQTLKHAFYALSAAWALSVLMFGLGSTDELLLNGFVNICLPVGLPTALIVGVRHYFKGYGVMLSAMWAALGFATSFVPLFVLRFVNGSMPVLFIPVVLLLSAIYVLVCHLTDNSKVTADDKAFIADVMDDDMKSSLLEPLYYTFKTRSSRFKGSKFGVLDDVKNRLRAVSGDLVIHYALWSLLALVVLIDLIVNIVL